MLRRPFGSLVPAALLTAAVATTVLTPAAFSLTYAGDSSAASRAAGDLEPGAKGEEVAAVQRTLKQNGYYPGPENGLYAQDMTASVWAFQKAQGLKPTSTINAETREALKNPRAPKKLVPQGQPNRVEVSLGSQLMTVYKGNKPLIISHVSTGSGRHYCSAGRCRYATTPQGDFRVYRKVPGWEHAPLGDMYKSLYFHQGWAIHGSLDVPLRPDSHGCVRVPMFFADELARTVQNGWPVHLR